MRPQSKGPSRSGGNRTRRRKAHIYKQVQSPATPAAVISLKSQERTEEPFANSDSWYPTSWVWLSAFKLKNCGYSIGKLERRWSATSRMGIFAGDDSTPFAKGGQQNRPKTTSSSTMQVLGTRFRHLVLILQQLARRVQTGTGRCGCTVARGINGWGR